MANQPEPIIIDDNSSSSSDGEWSDDSVKDEVPVQDTTALEAKAESILARLYAAVTEGQTPERDALKDIPRRLYQRLAKVLRDLEINHGKIEIKGMWAMMSAKNAVHVCGPCSERYKDGYVPAELCSWKLGMLMLY